MVVHIKQLSGARLKKSLGLKRAVKRWHNKNKSGGNFGINLYPTDKQYIGGQFHVRAWEYTGYHDLEGNVYSLSFSRLYQGAGVTIINRGNYLDMTYAELIMLTKMLMARDR